MSEIYWYLTPFDGHYPWTSRAEASHELDLEGLKSHVQQLDADGFAGVLYASNKQDPIVVATALLAATKNLKFLIPIYPGLTPPRLLAEQVLTVNHYFGNRLILNAVNGRDTESAAYGLPLNHDARYRLAADYWRLFRGFYDYRGDSPSYQGTYLDPTRFSSELGGTGLDALGILGERSVVKKVPFENVHDSEVQIWGAGASPAGQELAGQQIDVYLGFLRSLDDVDGQFRSARAAAARHGREYAGFGLRAGIVVRPSHNEAVEYFYDYIETTGVDQLLDDINTQIKIVTGGAHDVASFTAPDAKRQSWIDNLRKGQLPTLNDLQIGSHVYVGVNPHGTLDIFNNFDGKYFVGNPDEIIESFGELEARLPKLTTYILSAWPLDREATYVAEYVLPRL